MGRPRNYENMLVLVLFLTFGAIFLDRSAQFYLAPYIIPDLRINNQQIGIMASVLALAWALATVVFGAVSDRVGRRAVLIPSVIAFSLLSWVSGVVRTYEEMLIVRGLMGLAEGAAFSSMMATVEESSTPSRRGRNVGIVISAASLIGTAVTPVMTTQVAAFYGWRAAFFVAGIPGLILAAIIYWYVAESKERGQSTERAGIGTALALLKYRNMWLCCLAGAANLTSLFLDAVFAPLYITQVAHQAPTTAGFLLSAGGLGAFVAGFVFPALSDRIGRKPVLLIMAVGTVFLPLSLLVPALYEHPWLFAALRFVLSSSQAIAALVLVLIPTETVPQRYAATAIGLATMTAEIVGATIAPALGGAVAQNFGLAQVLVLAAASNIALFIVTLFLTETAGAKAPPAAASASGTP